MANSIELIVGLGNPGPRYDQTRHNAGFWFVDALADRFGGRFLDQPRFHGELCRLDVGGGTLRLLKPGTFMNRSGLSVCALAAYLRIDPASILIAHDEIDLPPGTARLKRGGGHGGHNGLRDIMQCLGREFWRLRLGVGHPGHKDEVVGYVLSRPGREDEKLIRRCVDDAVGLVELVVAGEMEKAMHRLHTKVE